LRLFRLARRGDLGRLVVMLVLVTLNRDELAALKKGVGIERRRRWEYGRGAGGIGS
jgi:hypothetical protein